MRFRLFWIKSVPVNFLYCSSTLESTMFGILFQQTNKQNKQGTKRYPSRKTRLTWHSFSPAQAPGGFAISPGPPTQTLKLHHHVTVYKPTWRFFFFYSNTDSKSPPPSVPDVDTVVHCDTHLKISFCLKTHCNLMVRLDPTPRPSTTTELYVNMEPEESLPNEFRAIGRSGLLLYTNIFWIFGSWDFF